MILKPKRIAWAVGNPCACITLMRDDEIEVNTAIPQKMCTLALPSGTEYYNPKNPNESVRVMQGNLKSPYPNSQKPYVRQRDKAGNYLDSSGKPGPNKSAETHISLDEFEFSQ